MDRAFSIECKGGGEGQSKVNGRQRAVKTKK
jgi:hypothetical protein